VAPATAASIAAQAAPVAPASPEAIAPIEPIHAIHVDKGVVVMNGKTRKWSDLTTEEKAEIRQSIAEARRELAEHRVDGREIQVEIQKAMAEAKFDKEDLRRELAEARAEIASAMAEIDAHRSEMTRAGVDPEQLKASIKASLKGVESIDVEAIRRSALASVNMEQIQATVDHAMRAAEAELDRVEALDNKDDD
jgi:Spy/CpxP family protein refolding chaperone